MYFKANPNPKFKNQNQHLIPWKENLSESDAQNAKQLRLFSEKHLRKLDVWNVIQS